MRHLMYAILLVCFAAQPASGATATSFTVSDLDAQVTRSADIISTQLALAGEFARLREALGEMGSADRARLWEEALQYLRTSGPASTDAMIRQSLEAALRLLNAAEAGMKAPRWPSDRPASAYQAIATARLQYARQRWPSMRAGEGLVQFAAPIAEVLWWTQGRTGGARVFDGLDDEVTAGAQRIFTNLGLKAPPVAAAATPAYVPPPVAQAPTYPRVVPGTRDMIDVGPGPQPGASRWSYSGSCAEGPFGGQWELMLAPDGTLSGRHLGANEGDVGTLSGRVQGNRVEFTRRGVFRGMSFEQQWIATLSGNAMQGGTIARPTERLANCVFTANALTPVQTPPVATAPPTPITPVATASRWSYAVRCPEGSSGGQWDLSVAPNGALSGRFMNTNETDVGTISGRVQGNRVEFTRRAVYRGTAFEQQWYATLSGNAMQGGTIARPTERLGNCSFTASSTSPAQPPVQQTGGFEYNVDRYGGDYRMFDLPRDDPQTCAATCQREGQCRAWTHVRSGGGNPAKCWLKNQVTPGRSNPDTVSGVVR